MSIKKTKTWSAYRRLLRRYRLATESLLRVPIEEGNTRYVKAMKEYKNTLAQMDAFMLSHIAIRAIAKNLTVE